MNKAWNNEDKELWFNEQKVQRSYKKDVLDEIDLFKNDFDVELYGKLSLNEKRYPLYAIKSKNFDKNAKNVLITGGVHGYETSGVLGVLAFIKNYAKDYTDFNLFMLPCLSPWAYETINRWNHKTIDPNRSFNKDSKCEESIFLIEFLEALDLEFYLHVDLHETTNSDNSIFRPALALRDGKEISSWEIPDGFYLVGDVNNPNTKMQENIIQEVQKITHIAPSDNDGRIIGEKITAKGVINYETKKLSLCSSITGAKFCTTTEVYPNSKKTSPGICIDAQVIVIKTALEYIKND